MDLTQSMEDYLETIYLLKRRKGNVRIKDIVNALKIAPPSVTEAVGNMIKWGFVKHEKYGDIELTEKGIKEAERVYQKHKVLFEFLSNILMVNENEAETDACSMEHYISKQTYERFVKFIEFVNSCDTRPNWLKSFHYYLENGKKPEYCEGRGGRTMNEKGLDELSINDKGKIIKIDAEKALKKKFLDMGFIPGTAVEVVGIAPLGDPIEVKLRGYKISLRKEEAKSVLIEVVK